MEDEDFEVDDEFETEVDDDTEVEQEIEPSIIDDVLNRKPSEFKDKIEDMLNAKAIDALEQEKASIASQMFGTPIEEPEEDDEEYEELEQEPEEEDEDI